MRGTTRPARAMIVSASSPRMWANAAVAKPWRAISATCSIISSTVTGRPPPADILVLMPMRIRGPLQGSGIGSLQTRKVLLANLRHFWRDDDLAIRLVGVLLEVVLVVALRWIEPLQRLDLRHDRRMPDATRSRLFDHRASRSLLFR